MKSAKEQFKITKSQNHKRVKTESLTLEIKTQGGFEISEAVAKIWVPMRSMALSICRQRD